MWTLAWTGGHQKSPTAGSSTRKQTSWGLAWTCLQTGIFPSSDSSMLSPSTPAIHPSKFTQRKTRVHSSLIQNNQEEKKVIKNVQKKTRGHIVQLGLITVLCAEHADHPRWWKTHFQTAWGVLVTQHTKDRDVEKRGRSDHNVRPHLQLNEICGYRTPDLGTSGGNWWGEQGREGSNGRENLRVKRIQYLLPKSHTAQSWHFNVILCKRCIKV